MGFNEYDRLTHVLLRPAEYAFSADRLSQWQALHFTAPPDLDRALREYDAFGRLLMTAGVDLAFFSDADAELTLDSIYVRDASVLSPRGAILCRMGKPLRGREPILQKQVLERIGTRVIGAIDPPGQLEGGDVVWFDEHTVAVGRGYRTNDAGIAQFQALIGDDVEVIAVPLPHHRGPQDVFHLMSILSPLDRDLAVVYSPLMPVPFREWLLARGVQFVEVPDGEFDAMGCNVLATAPRRCVMVDGAPITQARLEAAGVDVMTYEGTEISLKGGGGPTCLTRPLVRRA